MLTLKIEVPEARDRTAIATLRDGVKTLATDHAVASATPTLAAQHGNPDCDPLRLCGHPPLGRYRLLNRQRAPDHVREYGSHILLFEPEAGPALDAESFGRLALLAYGGAKGRDNAMRRTQGGLRLSDTMLHAVVSRLSPGQTMKLELVPLRPRPWWQFWKSQMATEPLSGTVTDAPEAPADELSLLETLLRKSVRSERRPVSQTRDDSLDRDRNRDHDRSSSSSSSEREAFQGKGGDTGGGGTSGTWSDAPGRGVDSAGRIIGAAAAVGAVGAMAAMASSAAHEKTGSGGGGAESSDAGSSSSTDTTTGTSY